MADLRVWEQFFLDITVPSDTNGGEFMPCYHPLRGWLLGTQPNGKQIIKILSAADPREIPEDKRLDIPCGQCIGCRMAYAQEWANRLMLELQDYDPARCFFITLTYNDDHLPERGSLVKRHVQLFMKRLRRQIEPVKCRFYAVGEYGSRSARPHYHLVIFNLPLPAGDLHFYKRSELGYNYQVSDLISKCWPYGFNVVAPVTWESCCYTARYMLKKMKGAEAHVYSDFGIAPPFAICSRKPGIGRSYLENHPDLSQVSCIPIRAGDYVKHAPPPRYFERVFADLHPEEAAQRREVRKISAISRKKLILQQTDLSSDYYSQNLENTIDRASRLLYNYRAVI